MIIARYLARDILLTTFAITLVLLLVVFSGRLSSYIADAATGRLAADLVFPILLARIPEYLELVLPLAIFLGILLAMGQRRESNELVAMTACGVGPGRLLSVTLSCGCFVALIVALFTFFVTPRGGAYVNELISAQGLQSELSNVTPGRFYDMDNGRRTLYTRELSEDREVMHQVFLSGSQGETQNLVLAERATQEYADNGGFYFVLENGRRFEGNPGQADFRITDFERYYQLLPDPEPANQKVAEEGTLMLGQLFERDSLAGRAELGWRLSLPVMVLLLALMAQPLSRAGPRQSRFVGLLPAVGLYLLYYLALNAVREEIHKGDQEATSYIGLHLGFLALGLVLYSWPALRNRLGWRA